MDASRGTRAWPLSSAAPRPLAPALTLPEIAVGTIAATTFVMAQQQRDHLFALALKGTYTVKGPIDPNAIYGPGGFGSQGFIMNNTALPYVITFDNKPTAMCRPRSSR